MSTPDTEWEKEFDERFSDESSVFEGGDPYGSRRKSLKAFITHLLTSRDTYWKERVREEKLGWEGYVVVDPQSNNYKCSPIFSSVKEAEKWRRDFGESALKVATVDVILKN